MSLKERLNELLLNGWRKAEITRWLRHGSASANTPILSGGIWKPYVIHIPSVKFSDGTVLEGMGPEPCWIDVHGGNPAVQFRPDPIDLELTIQVIDLRLEHDPTNEALLEWRAALPTA